MRDETVSHELAGTPYLGPCSALDVYASWDASALQKFAIAVTSSDNPPLRPTAPLYVSWCLSCVWLGQSSR